MNIMYSFSSSSSCSNSPCAACKFLRRKCRPGCVFAPYFPPEDPQKFVNVHKIFGASNVAKLLNEVLPHQKEDAVSSLAYEAEARVRDPVYGCAGVISSLKHQVNRLQKNLDAANAEFIINASSSCHHHRMSDHHYSSLQPAAGTPPQISRTMDHEFYARRIGGGGGGVYDQPAPPSNFPYYQVNRDRWNWRNFSNSQLANINMRDGNAGESGGGRSNR